MKENPWAFWFYFLTCCLNSLFDEEWASADCPWDTTTKEARNCPTGTHSHPTPADLALERRILPEKDPQRALLPLPTAADWRFWLVLLLVGFFLLSCLFVLSMKSCGLVLAPRDNLAEIPTGMLELIAAGSLALEAGYKQCFSPQGLLSKQEYWCQAMQPFLSLPFFLWDFIC